MVVNTHEHLWRTGLCFAAQDANHAHAYVARNTRWV